jgi:hypothetical protein
MVRAAHFPGLFGGFGGVAVKTKEGGRYNSALRKTGRGVT